MAFFTEQELRMRGELEKAIRRRNVDKDGVSVRLVNGQEPTKENVARVVERTRNEKGGLDEMERHLVETLKRKRQNPNAGVEDVRRWEVVDSRAVTWDDVIRDTEAIIMDRKQYIKDVELAGEWYEKYGDGKEGVIARRVADGKAQAWDRDGELDSRGTGWENPDSPPYSTENLGERFYDNAPSYLQARVGRIVGRIMVSHGKRV